MALRRTAGDHIFNMTKISSPVKNMILTHSPFSSPFPPDDPSRINFSREFLTESAAKNDGCGGGGGGGGGGGSSGGSFFRRFLQKRRQSAMASELLSRPIGDTLIEKLKKMNLNRERIRLDGLIPPQSTKLINEGGISINEVKKLLKIAQLEKLKSNLRRIPKNSIPYSEFIQICQEGSNVNEALSFAKMLDESGAVIVLRDTVFLRPEQVAKAIEGVIPLSVAKPRDPRSEELAKMEKEKAKIDQEAEALVRKELWAGLGFMIVQTLGFMRLTFVELSWDIMEPVCFYVTSAYFMAGYAFFLRTSKDPSFEGFFESRFLAKQKKLMKSRGFDLERFNALKKACQPFSSEHSATPVLDHSNKTLTHAMNP